MEIVNITIANDCLSRQKEMASDFDVTIEELICWNIESMLSQPEPNFQRAMDYILSKNRELYQRLQ